MTEAVRPIIIVTGATGGIGFGICKRLLFQCCHSEPSDALPQSFTKNDAPSDPPQRYHGLTLVLACRSVKRATAARENLFRLLDSYVAELQRRPYYDGNAHIFRENLSIDIVSLDFAMISPVFKFGEEISSRYPYISHLICNAGYAGWTGIDWVGCIKQLVREPLYGVTVPNWVNQQQGEISIDGLGWVWQCNLFVHYVLYRSIQHLLMASPPSLGSRVIWTSSLEANPNYFDLDDWQLKKSAHPYEGSKYQIELISTYLDRLALKETGPRRLRHFVSHPGVCSTDFSVGLAGPILAIFKVMAFYIARFCGSVHHPINPYKGSIAAVHLALASLTFLTIFENLDKETANITRPVKFGSQSDRWGNEHVGLLDVQQWDRHKSSAEILLGKMDALMQSMKNADEVSGNEP